MKLNKQLLAHMRKATRTLLNKGPVDTAAIVQEAMKHANAFQRPAASPGAPPLRDLNPPPSNGTARQASSAGTMPDMLANLQRSMEAVRAQFGGLGGTEAQASWPGSFISGSHANAAGARDYKLYVPSTLGEGPAALVVMLHGCTQDPDDFAHGTGMNALAEELRCLVVYPAQSQSANPSRCWNWFNEADQQHGRGEPSIIAGITRDVMARYPVDARQVFVAGLSAGGAMATIMGTLYPDLYAAVGVHSGLPFAAANDLPSALAAMKGEFRRSQAPGRPLPVIVFHGDRDTTVHPANGDALVAHARAARKTAEPGQVPDGHAYTRTTHHHADGTLHAEHWLIHGAGHAWSGGNARGSYTDGRGPDASREMMRFFRTRR
ncbi:PHB depolymerase family esterase [Massilia sp. MS-15]|uniref:extracellular catalytic domain type 1 short-chain-length polyhydroxyalkanoate depolymerase n=1 Tax=Massilia sp. MS-15 TaxID=2878200 RepID=UPI001CD7816F|nr:PHB depolymerase family esterase [Massilia sp. MS-15]MCA1245419.1 PHB depolymerase family esterase [Massilia sp. MS-15]